MTLWLELALLLACVVVGARIGGIGLGVISGIGLLVLVFVLGEPPGGPPGTVLGMILAVVAALAMLESAGGLALVIRGAERLLRSKPKHVTVLAPLVTYGLVLASGTQHVIYALLPVIAEVARKAGVRPERPISISVIAAQQGLIASPISAVTVALVGGLAASGVGLPQVMVVVIPATLLGVIAGTLSVAFRGVELADDPEFERRQAEAARAEPAAAAAAAEPKPRALGACVVFAVAIAAVVLVGLFPGLRPTFTSASGEPEQVEMGRAIMIIMLAAAGVLAIGFRASPEEAIRGGVMKGGLTAIICILGVSWLGSSFFEANQTTIVGGIEEVIQARPWVFAAGLFTLSILLFSQAATVVTLLPVGLALGLPVPLLVGSYPAVNGNFFLPTYGTVVAAVSFDTTGTTRIGRYLLNHSFMRPGLVATAVSLATAFALAQVVF